MLDISDLEESVVVHLPPSALPFYPSALSTSRLFVLDSKETAAVRECCWWTPGAALETEGMPFEETPAVGW